MTLKRLSELDYYMKPEVYASDRADDNTGPQTRLIIERMLGLPANEIVLIGDTEEDFDCEYMEVLDEIVEFNGYKERCERYDEEYDTSLTETLYETNCGDICVVSGETQHGTISVYFSSAVTSVGVLATIEGELSSAIPDTKVEAVYLTQEEARLILGAIEDTMNPLIDPLGYDTASGLQSKLNDLAWKE